VKTIYLLLLVATSAVAQSENLSGTWKLSLIDSPDQAQPQTDDSTWSRVTLPHRTPRPERMYWLRRTVAAPASADPLLVTVGLVSESYEI